MKSRKRSLHTSTTSKSSNPLKYHHELLQFQLNNEANDERMKEDERSTLEFKQEAHNKYEETQKTGVSNTNGGVSNESNTFDLNSNGETNVKQEELAKSEVVLQDNTVESRRSDINSREQSVELGQVEPDIDDPNFYCRSCNYTLSNKSGYRSHLKKYHKMNLKPLVPIRNPAILPDWDDPYQYCKSCNYTYASRNTYKAHCKYFHKMKAPTRSAGIPDIRDPNSYCKVCNHTYKSKSSYITHCVIVHKIRRGQRFANPEATPDVQDPNNYCIRCDRTFCSRYAFRNHLFRIHQLKLSLPNEIAPDIDDPNNHCRSCDKTFDSRYSFRIHLASIHFIGKLPYEKSNAYPDVDDPNNYCRVCQRSYVSRAHYRTHLKGVHQMILRPQKNLNNLPDPDDPNLYCRVCDKTKETLVSYREHCMQIHRMVLRHHSISNPNATIDITSRDNYCAQCEYRYSSKYAFVCHLQTVHDMYVNL
ncbi:Translation machinery-associated protein 46 [Mucor velutinosus]|uniref:Translation machinery-associated protein 46 n=1 Tax=Mucor velutinosus TaxID=708070 RepID=A0AAN7DL53_9FUNG|nr:Translation machinery-associated protein 46 [Mucor velutinosus]